MFSDHDETSPLIDQSVIPFNYNTP